MERKNYEEPKFRVHPVTIKDVICTSGEDDKTEVEGAGGGGWN